MVRKNCFRRFFVYGGARMKAVLPDVDNSMMIRRSAAARKNGAKGFVRPVIS